MNGFAARARKRRLRAIGLMSGTSADGITAALIDFRWPRSLKLLDYHTYPYPAPIRRAVLELCTGKAGVADVCHMNFVLGELFAEAALKLMARAGVKPASVDVIGSHGQTIWHEPQGRRLGRRLVPSTLQIAEGGIIAERTGTTVVCDFRPRDMAAGGQGAPLVPFVDHLLLTHPRRNRAVQNIGGIANVTWLPAGGNAGQVLAFDSGPGNMVMDRLTELATAGRQAFDRNGRLAARGRVNEPLLAELMAHPFLSRRPPKSTGREMFGSAFAEDLWRRGRSRGLSGADLLATATAFTARSIAQAYNAYLPRIPNEVLLCGGGAKNPVLVKLLVELLSPARVQTSDEVGLPAEAKEAVSFAVLAAATLRGEAGNIPSATGALHPAVLGKIIP